MALTLDGALTRFSDDAGGDRPNPLVRNSNNNTRYDETKAGPRGVVKKGEPGTAEAYVMLWESINSNTASSLATSSDGEDWAKDDANNPVLGPTETWENDEAAASDLVWDPDNSRYLLYYHGGGNGNVRQIAVAESTDLVNWTKLNGGQPVVSPGSSGAWDEGWVADPTVIRRGANDWIMYFRGQDTLDNSGTIQIGLATSTDGVSWTKSGSNPVLTPGSAGAWDETHVLGPAAYLDPDGTRAHLWYAGEDSGGTQGLGYARSDDDTTFTKGGNNPVLTANSESDSPDNGFVGDTLEVFSDGDKLFVLYGANDLDSYTGAGGTPCRGICGAWLPLPRETTPTVPGRFFEAGDQVEVPQAQTLFDDAVYTVAVRLRAPSREEGTYREIYTEDGDGFNEQIFMRLDGDSGKGGQLNYMHRTPNAFREIDGTARLDDNLWHNVAFRRPASDTLEIVADGTTETSSAGSDPGTVTQASTNPGMAIGNWLNETTAAEPLQGTIGRIAVWTGKSLTNAQIDAFLDDGTLPDGVEPDWWYDLGSGSPEPDQSSSANNGTVTGTTVVDAAADADVVDVTPSQTISAPVAAATAEAPTPSVSPGEATLSPPVAEALADALPPQVAASIALSLPVADAQADAPDVTPSTLVALTPPVASASAEAPTPSLGGAQSLSAPVAEAEVTALSPTTSTSVTVTVPIASADADATAPSVTQGTVLSAPVASAEANATAPGVSTGPALLALVSAEALAEAPAPDPTGAVSVSPPVASVDVQALSPNLQAAISLALPQVEATVEALTPTLAPGTSAVTLDVAVVTVEALPPNVVAGELFVNTVTGEVFIARSVSGDVAVAQILSGDVEV